MLLHQSQHGGLLRSGSLQKCVHWGLMHSSQGSCTASFNYCLFWEYDFSVYFVFWCCQHCLRAHCSHCLVYLEVYLVTEVLLWASPATFHCETAVVPSEAKKSQLVPLQVKSVVMSCSLWWWLKSRLIIKVKNTEFPRNGMSPLGFSSFNWMNSSFSQFSF